MNGNKSKSLLFNNDQRKQGFSNPSLWGHLTISGLIIIGAAAIYGITFYYTRNLAGQWHVCLAEGEAKIQAPASKAGTMNPPEAAGQMPGQIHGNSQRPDVAALMKRIDELGASVSPGQKERLKNQLHQLQQAQTKSCEIGVYFCSNRNAVLTVSTLAAIVATSALAVISKDGWENSNNTFINIGVTSGLILFTASTFGQLYGQKDNYDSQRTNFILATNVLNTAASAIANQNMINPDLPADGAASQAKGILPLTDPANMATLIRYVDKQLGVINAINFTGDASFAEQSLKSVNSFLKTSDRLLPKP
ncbi:MAG: hypothetical protein VKO39_04545 [Cyanobacteriota bacterium]|nr:hypothetical protein [Cyanobacteriota bacterium]